MSWCVPGNLKSQEESNLPNVFFCICRSAFLASYMHSFCPKDFERPVETGSISVFVRTLSGAARNAETSVGACLNTGDPSPLDKTLFTCTSRAKVTHSQMATANVLAREDKRFERGVKRSQLSG